MITKRLYLQICAIFVASLLGFAGLASLAWSFLGEDDFNQDLFVRSASLAEMLLPDAADTDADQGLVLDRLHEKLDIDLALYSPGGDLIAHAGAEIALERLDEELEPGEWRRSRGGTEWTTRLGDGRYLVVNLDRIELPGETQVFVAFLGIIALAIAIIMYPFIRHLTGRLERLQHGVRQIGLGHLSARVDVEGDDEIAQLARSFNDAAKRIESLVQSQKLLLANASHELRTPLARIRMGIEMLQSGNRESRQKALESDIAELDELIDELIMMTRIDTIAVDRDFESFDLMGLVAEECARYPGCEAIGSSVDVVGDRRMIQQALRNLVDNAFKHGAAPVVVEVERQDNRAILRVRDGGPGISPQDRDKLFEPFQRGNGKQNVPGSGLGLALVRKIVDAHEGTLTILSDAGSTITLSLPVESTVAPRASMA